ncbi:MAG: hypothetical protein ACPG4Z_05900 [Chitinophagales bacterium]
MHKLIILFLIIIPSWIMAQDAYYKTPDPKLNNKTTKNNTSYELGDGYHFANIQPSATGGIGVYFNTKDVYVDFKLGFFDKQNVWSAGVEYGIRPGRPIIEVDKGTHFEQYKEKRQYFGAYLEKSIYPFSFGKSSKIGFTAGTGIGTQFRRYVGIKGLHTQLWVSPYAGLSVIPADHVNLLFGYRYHDTNAENIGNHRIFILITAF